MRKTTIKKLRKPLTCLLLAEELVDETDNGHKTVTVREGHRDYSPGKVVIACPEINYSIMKEIVEVHHTTPEKMNEKDYLDEGWTDRENMVEDLKRFYSDLHMKSPITVIRWK